MEKKIIIAHPGRQHSFRVASELKKNDLLFKYITTVYDKDSSHIMEIVKKFISGDNLRRANGRKNEDISDEDVIQFCEISGLIEILLARFDKKRNLYNWWQRKNSDRFGKKVAKYAIQNNVDAVILYDMNARNAFSILKEKAPNILRIMDVSAANRLYMKNVYESDFSKCPSFASMLKKERKILWDAKTVDRLMDEINLTHKFFVPSVFVKKSLQYSGVSEKRIAICPYGANFNKSVISKIEKKEGPLEAIYVGNIAEMKGIYYLLEAAKAIDKNKVHLTVVGAYDNSEGKFSEYMKNITFVGRVTHDKVLEYLNKSDFFVFPSLGEGLSLAVLEALACALPCIVTQNSGANDAIIEGENGFVVEIQSKRALYEKMLWFDEHRALIPKMSEKAAEAIDYFNWKNHERIMIEYLRKWLN